MYFALLALFRSYFIVFPPEGSHVFGLGTLELEGHQKNVQTTARFILDQVVAPVPHRHYVLAIPRMLRPYFQRHRHLLKRLCTLAHESLTEYLRTALGCPEGVPGIIMTLHTLLRQQ